jgi:colanic acid/amylovoran biosynthesis glycosyltransferase
MWNQVRFLPWDIESHIACRATANLEQYGLPRVYSLAAEPTWRRRGWYGVLRRFGLRQAFEISQARRCRAVVLHSHFGHVAWANLATAHHARLKHVATFYGFDVGHLPQSDPVWRRRYDELFRSVDLVLCEGPHMARCIEALGCPASRIRVHHLGVDLGELPFRPRRWSGDVPLEVLIVASFTEKKGIPDALAALAEVARDVDLQITIIGDAKGSTDGAAEKDRILEMIRRGGLQSRTRLLGYLPRARAIEELYRSHVLLSPSVTSRTGDTEGGAPVTLIEAAASGMPVVSTRHCDIPNVVVHGETGFLAGEYDVSGLVDCLRRLLSAPSNWGLMLEAARRRMEAQFNAVVQGERLAEIYRTLAAADRRG